MDFIYEHKAEPLLPFDRFLQRLAKSFSAIILLVLVSLFVGIIGYRITENMDWIDSLVNASMILSGMGPASEMHTTAGKLFASFYALYSGLFLIGITGAMLLPVLHRMMHKFHLESSKKHTET